MGSRRNEIKRYMESRYGEDQVCSVGTYTTFRVKAAIKELAKLEGVGPGEMNYISAVLDLKDSSFLEIFQNASKKSVLKNFIASNPNVINTIPLILDQPKSASIHPCATLILPKEKSVYEWIPVKKMNLSDGESMIITEWEGTELEQAGFLKEDILGIKQLDKFQAIIELIKENYNKDIDLEEIDLNNHKVYSYFKRGWNADVFHFGSSGLTGYCKQLKPDNIDDLIAGIALFRPGSMESNFHNEYVFRKDGDRKVEYDFGLEEVTKQTYGLYIFQEQILKACSVLGGINLVDADDVRRAMGKKKKDVIDKYGSIFVEGAKKKGCTEEEAKDVWSKLEKFASYGFNKCISGEEKFYRIGNKRDSFKFQPTIEEMFLIKNDKNYAVRHNHSSLHQKYKYRGFGFGWSLNEENRLIKNKIIDIRYEGIRDTYRLLLTNGSSIVVTENHKFPTNNGEKLLCDLDINSDQIYFNQGYESEDTSYRFTNKDGTRNNTRFHNDDFSYEYTLNSEKGKEGFQQKETSFTKLQSYLKKDFCEICGKPSVRMEVHHKDNNRGNNEPINLITACSSCHKKEHYKLGRVKQGQKGLLTELVSIKSITLEGKRSVYDVEMESPHHTFTTDRGIVTCNSHAAAYAITGYISQWFKVNYPTEYWSTAFKFSEEKDHANYISEINLTGAIKVMPANINKSRDNVYTDFQNKTIYWPLISIKQCGEKAASQIIELRDKDGQYFTFEEFLQRNKFKGSKVTKQVIENLVLSGAFDEIEHLGTFESRYKLILQYRKISKTKIDLEKDLFELDKSKLREEWWWILQQKRLSGIAFFDYRDLTSRYLGSDLPYIEISDFQNESNSDTRKKVKIGGYITEVEERTSKKGKWARIKLENNYTFINVVIWAEQYKQIETLNLAEKEKSLLLITGQISNDSFHKENVLQANDDTELLILI